MKVTVLVGSPHKNGSSSIMADSFEKGLKEKREKRNKVWSNVGLAVASLAAIAVTTYAVSEQSKAQNANSQSSPNYGGTGASHLSRANAITRESDARINQQMRTATAQLNQMTRLTIIKAQQAQEHIAEVGKEQLQWTFEFNEKNGRYPTEEEKLWWLYNNHRDIWELQMRAKAEGYGNSSY